MTQPPIIPGQPVEPPPPQIVYVQAPPTTSGAVSSGIMNAGGKVVLIILAICLGGPLTACLIMLALSGFGHLLGGSSSDIPTPSPSP